MKKINISHIVFLLVVLLSNTKLAASGPLQGYWNFDAQSGDDTSGNEKHGYFLQGNSTSTGVFAPSLSPTGPTESNYALVPFIDGGRGVSVNPLRIDELEGAAGEAVTVSMFYRLAGLDEYASEWTQRCRTQNSDPLTYADGLCSGTNDDEETYKRMYLLDTFDDTASGMQVYLNDSGELVTYVAFTTVVNDEETVYQLDLSASIYDPSISLTANTMTNLAHWYHVGVSYQPRTVTEREGNQNLIVDIALLLNGKVIDRDQMIIANVDLVPAEQLTLIGGVDLGRRAGGMLVGLIDEVRFYNRALTSFELSCLTTGGIQCVKQEIISDESLKGFRGLSYIDAELALTDSAGQVAACTNSDGSTVVNCQAGDLVATIYDASTSSAYKQVIVSGLQGSAGDRGVTGQSITNIELVASAATPAIADRLHVTYVVPVENAASCAANYNGEVAGSNADDTLNCEFSATFGPIKGQEAVAPIMDAANTINSIQYHPVSESNNIGKIVIDVNPAAVGETSERIEIPFDHRIFDTSAPSCNAAIEGGAWPGLEINSASWQPNSNENTTSIAGNLVLSTCSSTSDTGCQLFNLSVPKGLRGDPAYGDRAVCRIEEGEITNPDGDDGQNITGLSYNGATLTISYDVGSSDTFSIEQLPGANGTDKNNQVLVYSSSKGNSEVETGSHNSGGLQYACTKMEAKDGAFLTICTR